MLAGARAMAKLVTHLRRGCYKLLIKRVVYTLYVNIAALS
jgi:hypothetical protein